MSELMAMESTLSSLLISCRCLAFPKGSGVAFSAQSKAINAQFTVHGKQMVKHTEGKGGRTL